jgi:competence protein ComEA
MAISSNSYTQKMLKIVLVVFLIFGFCTSIVSGAGKVNINTAEKQELTTLKKVGDALAQRIIEFRKTHPFLIPEDIMKVKGIGEEIFETNKDRIIVKDE